MFFVYVLYSPLFSKFYIGQTNHIKKRLYYHNAGYNKSTAAYRPWVLKCVIAKNSRAEALTLEKKLKNLNKQKLIRFINKYTPGS
ncbi:MAG: GIY-YIG nuclease family protein [Bacteroidia bacterium]|nr:GIY-YIG nuclease family protein [Bacteroidia bacterium]